METTDDQQVVKDLERRYGLGESLAESLLAFHSDIACEYLNVLSMFESGIEEYFPTVPCTVIKEIAELYGIEDIFDKLYGTD